MKVYITGISGTGKTSIAYALREKGIKAIDMDEFPDLCFWINRMDGQTVDYEAILDKEFLSSHVWVCDVELLKKLLDAEGMQVMAGHSENYIEFLHLFDKVILLQCRPETFLNRIAARKNNDFGKEETAREFILNTFEKFESDMLKKGAISINTEGPLEKTFEKVIDEIKRN